MFGRLLKTYLVLVFLGGAFTAGAQSAHAALDSLLNEHLTVEHNGEAHKEKGTFTTRSINFYKRIISPMYASRCVFHPSCSQYSKQAFEKYNLLKALLLSLDRLTRCHPKAFIYPYKYDPINDLNHDSP